MSMTKSGGAGTMKSGPLSPHPYTLMCNLHLTRLYLLRLIILFSTSCYTKELTEEKVELGIMVYVSCREEDCMSVCDKSFVYSRSRRSCPSLKIYSD